MSVLTNLVYHLDQFKLQVPHLEISDNGVTALIGPSGSGKTSLFKVLLGIYQPTNWHWIFKGVDLAQLSLDQRQLGVVFQTYELFPHLTAEMNIKLIMEARRNNDQSAFDQLNKYKDQLNLNRCWNTQAEKLSGGEQQRVALLRAIMSRPRIILLDEPFSALDQSIKQEAYLIVKDLLYETQIPALMITHQIEEAKHFTDRFIYMENGQIV